MEYCWGYLCLLWDTDLTSVKMLYIAIGSVIAFIAICFSFVKVPKIIDPHAVSPDASSQADLQPTKSLFAHKHFVWAVVAQFFNTAAQAGTWAFFINYGHEIMGFSDEKAGNYLILFMGAMLLGRFVGTFIMRVVSPPRLLAIFAACNILMCIIVAQAWGWPSFVALLMINFFFGIMFPTIFSLGLKNLGAHTQQASSFISMGVVGAALFPFVMGAVADQNVANAYYLPIICYVVIFMFGAKFYKVRS
jgi:FHS family L-fucose permease-like MFS transporter